MEVCRVCRSAEPTLLTPCKCSGSMRFVHQECLEEWLKHSSKNSCEICNYKFKFTPIYSDDIPQKFELSFIIKALGKKSVSLLLENMRILVVVFCWLILSPWILSIGWKLFFDPFSIFSFKETRSFLDYFIKINISKPFLRQIVKDIVFGQLVCVQTVVFYLSLLLLKEHIRANTRLDELRDRQRLQQRIDRLERQVLNNMQAPQLDDSDDDALDNDLNQIQANQPQEPVPAEPQEQGLVHMVGLKGPFLDFLMNLARIDGLMILGIGCLVWIPFMTGKFILSCFKAFLLPLLRFLLREAIDFVLFAGKPLLLKIPESNLNLAAQRIAVSRQFLKGIAKFLFALEFTSFAIGCCAIGGVLVWQFSKTQEWNHPYTKAVRRMLLDSASYLLKIVKTVFFTSIELIFFPVYCGIVCDICSILVIDGFDLEKAFEFHTKTPFISMFLHWTVGTCFMIQFSNMVMTVRETVRPGVLWFIRDPQDPRFNPIQEIMEKPISVQFKKLFKGQIMYTLSVILLFGSFSLLGKLFFILKGPPFNLSLNNTLSDTAPVELVLYHLAAPFIYSSLDPFKNFKRFFKWSLEYICSKLLLNEFMLGKSDLKENHVYYQVPNHDHIDYKPGDLVVTLIGKDDELDPRGLTGDQIKATWRKVAVPMNFKYKIILMCLAEAVAVLTFLYSIVAIGLSTGYLVFKAIQIYKEIAMPNDAVLLLVGLGLVSVVRVFDFSKITVNLILYGWSLLLCPLLVGLNFDLYCHRPVRYILSESSELMGIVMMWCWGSVIVFILTGLALMGQPSPLKHLLEQIRDTGLYSVDFKQFMELLGGPLTRVFVGFSAFPMCFGYFFKLLAVFMKTELDFLVLSYPIVLGFVVLALVVNTIKLLIDGWIEAIRDEKYMVGRRLHNLTASAK